MRQNRFHGNVFVANLPNDYTDEQLAQLFDPYGIVVSAFLARDAATGARRGFGLVNVAPDTVANTAIAALNGTQIGNRRIEVRRSDPEMSINIPKPQGMRSRPSAMRPHSDLPAPAVPNAVSPHAVSGGAASGGVMPAATVSSRPPVVVEYRRPRRVVLPARPV